MEQIERSTGSRLVYASIALYARGKHTLGDRESRTPLVSEDVKTDAAVGVDVGVVNPGGEVDLRGLEWVVGGEVDVQEENTS
jgi:hypothetical protein